MIAVKLVTALFFSSLTSIQVSCVLIEATTQLDSISGILSFCVPLGEQRYQSILPSLSNFHHINSGYQLFTTKNYTHHRQ